MGKRPLSLSVLLGCLVLAASGYGQAVHEEENETLRATSPPAKTPMADVAKAAKLIVEQTNEFRQQHGRPSKPILT